MGKIKLFFSKIWKWCMANKVIAGIIAGATVAVITVAIVVPISVSNAHKKANNEAAIQDGEGAGGSSGDNQPGHTHTYSDEWSKDATSHWHASTCGHEVKSGEAEHSFGAWTIISEEKEERTCEICGYKEQKDHVHTFSAEWSFNDSGHWHASTCGHDVKSDEGPHSFGAWEIISETEERQTCSDCGYYITQTHEHTYSSEWTYTSEHHWHDSECGHDVTDMYGEHTFDDYGFCTECGCYSGSELNFELDETGLYYFCYSGKETLEDNKLYFYRIGGGHEGHQFNLEDGDPLNLGECLVAYIMVDNVLTEFSLSANTATSLGDDGYIYIVIDSTNLDDLEDVWFEIREEHIAPEFTPLTLGYLGICPACGEFEFETKSLNETISATVIKGHQRVFRYAMTEDSEYGLWAGINEDINAEARVEAFVIVDEEPVLLDIAEDYDMLLLHVTDSDDGYIYLVLRFEGEYPNQYFEEIAIYELNAGYDPNRFFYGESISDFSDSHDLEGDDYKINGNYYFAIDINGGPGDYKYKVEFDGLNEGDTFNVFQDNGSAVIQIVADDYGYFTPESSESLVVQLISEVPGSQIDVLITEVAI